MAKLYYSKELDGYFLDQLKKELSTVFEGCKTIAIKIHFGEPGNKTSFSPEQIKPITDILKSLNINYYLYDSSVAYDSPRGNPESHKKVALEKGWGELGEIRTDDEYIEVKGENLTYEVCKSLVNADGVLVISHVKGHVCSGFGGAIKNLGMGALTKKTKAEIHTGGKPNYVGGCTQCKLCEANCPIGGITVTDKPNIITCFGCSNCTYVCPVGALVTKLNDFDTLLAEGAKVAESTFKKKYYMSYLVNITKECDCKDDPKQIIAGDCGYLMGEDAVAIDKASYDLINESSGENRFKRYNFKDGSEQIVAAENFNMGSSQYKKINLES